MKTEKANGLLKFFAFKREREREREREHLIASIKCKNCQKIQLFNSPEKERNQ